MKLLLALVSSMLLASSLSAQLIVNVDTAQKQYFLSGSATGTPGGEEDFGYSVFWDNAQAYDGGFEDLLSLSAFNVQGNNATSLTIFLHGNGNVNGALNLESGNAFTLSGNPEVRFDYSTWAPAVIVELESKAKSGEFLPTVEGSPDFGMQFAVVPEPSAYALLTISGVALMAIRRVARR